MGAIALGRFGDLIIGEESNNAVDRLFAPFTQHAAGTGVLGFADGASNQAKFFSPSGVAVAPDGGIIVADRMNNRIRKILCGGTNMCAASGNACPVTATDDQNSCTTDSCMVLAIKHDALANGVACTDGNACTVADTCSAAVCQSGTPVATNDNNACTTDACNSSTGVVSHTPVPTNDNDNCTIDACDTAIGTVTHTPKTFADSNTTDCLVPVCNPANGAAMNVDAAEGTPCGAANSGQRCALNHVCEVAAPTFTPPALDSSTGTDFGKLTDDIWKGAGAVQKLPNQTNISATKIDPGHAGWLIGQVKTAGGLPMPNVVVSIPSDAGFGETKTRSDGKFDLIVNGGRSYTVRFTKAGHFSVDRDVYVGWEETRWVSDVIMLAPDSTSTALGFAGGDVNGSAAQQVATAATMTDDNGSRTAKLILPQGTTASINGTRQSNLTLRITEYTVGADGPARMPAALPPGSGYTYAVEVSADQAPGQSVTFNKPVYYYVDDFLGVDRTKPVPSGYYDAATRQWVPSTNGIVVKVLKGTPGVPVGSPAEIDINGDDIKDTGTALTNLGFTNAELIELAKYADGKSLWRIPIDHMTPWDFNYGAQTCDATCRRPGVAPVKADKLQCQQTVGGSIIGCETQSLGESFPVAGTPFRLYYDSTRMRLYANNRTLQLRVKAVNPGGTSVVKVTVAGRKIYEKEFNAGEAGLAEQLIPIAWDGNDAFGRPVVGSATAVISGYLRTRFTHLTYIDKFGNPNPYGGERVVTNYTFDRRDDETTQLIPALGPTVGKGSWLLGGWTLDVHHFFDPKTNLLFLGTGQRRLIDPGLSVIKRILGTGGGTNFASENTSATAPGTGVNSAIAAVAVAPNGDIYFADPDHFVIRRINAAGEVKTIAGNPNKYGCGIYDRGDGKDSVAFGVLREPRALAFGRDGELYFWDAGDRTIRRLTPTGTDTFSIDTVAGTPCVAQNGAPVDVPASTTPLPMVINGIAVGPDGTIYLADYSDFMIKRFKVGGNITKFAGNGAANANITEGASPSTSVAIGPTYGIAVGGDGQIYSSTGSMVYRIGPEGTFSIIKSGLSGVNSVAVTATGSVVFNVFAAQQSEEVWLVDRDGTQQTLSKPTPLPRIPPVDGVAASGHGPYSISSLTLAPDGSVLVFALNSIYRVGSGRGGSTTACGDSNAAHLIPAGDEAYCFDSTGRHLSTVNRRTGAKLYTFTYASGSLQKVTDGDNRDTLIALQSDGAGELYAVTAPFKQVTQIRLDENRNATSLKDPLGNAATALTGGLMPTFTDRNGSQFSFGYQGDGLLTTDTSPLSVNPQTLVRSDITGGYRVTHTTPLNRVTTYDVTTDALGQATVLTTYPDGTSAKREEHQDFSSILTAPDLTQTTTTTAPDPILGYRQPIRSKQIKLPSGLTLTVQTVACDPQTVAGVTTEFSASAFNPASALTCNPAAPASPFDNQASPPFSNPPHTSYKRVSDANGETLTTVSPEGRSSVEKRNAIGRITSAQIGQLTPTLFTYDLSVGHEGQLKYVDRGIANNRRTQFDYRAVNESDPVTPDPDAGFVKHIANAVGDTADFTRDYFGRARTVIEAKNVAGKEGTTLFDWDGNGNLKLVQPPGQPAHNMLYDAINGLKQYTPPVVAGVATPQTTYLPTADRTPSTETRPDGVVITHNLVTSPQPSDQIDTITLTKNGTTTGIVDYTYYQATDTAAGQAPGRVKSIAGPYGSTLLSFEYNGNVTTKASWSKVLTSSEGSSSVAWGYSSNAAQALQRTSETVTPLSGALLSRYFAYDNDNLLTCNASTTPPNCSTLTSLDLKLARSLEHGGVTDLTWGSTAAAADRLSEHWDYSDSAPDAGGTDSDVANNRAFGELRRQSLNYGSSPTVTTLAEIVYDAPPVDARDDLGRILTKTETFRNTGAPVTTETTYQYDERGRLESVTNGLTSLPIESFGYDVNGNRTSYTPATGSALVGKYDAQDRLTNYGTSLSWAAVGDIKYAYGNNGELTQRDIKTGASTFDTWTYGYDPLGNLVTVTKPGKLYTYLVDGLGRRIGKKEKIGAGADTLKKRWLYRDGLAPVAEMDASGKLTAVFVYGSRANIPDLVIKIDPVTAVKTTYRLFSDQLGSPRLAVNVNDRTDIKYRVDYSAFGVPNPKLNSSGTLTDLAWIPFGFAGGLYDADTQLERFGARDYDPSVGRWASKDPTLFGGHQANLYVYVGNDPVNRVDPSGLEDGIGGAGGLGDLGGEGAPGFSPDDPQPMVCQTEAMNCFNDCMEAQGADYAADAFLLAVPFGPVPKTEWELGKTLGGGASTTTLASRLSFYLGMPARNGLRTAGRYSGYAAGVVAAGAAGYWSGSAAACAAECAP